MVSSGVGSSVAGGGGEGKTSALLGLTAFGKSVISIAAEGRTEVGDIVGVMMFEVVSSRLVIWALPSL